MKRHAADSDELVYATMMMMPPMAMPAMPLIVDDAASAPASATMFVAAPLLIYDAAEPRHDDYAAADAASCCHDV